MAKITEDKVDYIAKLANIPITKEEGKELADGFNKTMQVVEKLLKIEVSGIVPTHHTAGIINVLREDAVNEKNMLSQEEALSNAKNKHKGYFLVDRILKSD